MKKILFIDTNQFGYLIDSLKWCELLGDKYKITYISFDNGRDKIHLPNVKALYVPQLRIKALRGLLFLLYAFSYCFFFDGVIFVFFHEKLDLLKKLLPWKKMHLDIRSMCVSEDKTYRERQDQILRESVMKFDTVSAISKGVIKKLNVNKNISLLPLGADQISKTDKKFEMLRLFYVGTMTNRHIPETIDGIELFIQKHSSVEITYDIVGGDNGEGELEHVKQVVKNKGLENIVKIHGPKRHDELKPFFDNCNIGVCYVPITDYYQYQPPTKTFEYAFSGLATIATSTVANSEIINDSNGILIKDTAEDFCRGLEEMSTMSFDSTKIRESVNDFSWKKIVMKYLIPIIEELGREEYKWKKI